MKLYHGDCLEIMKDIPDKSIDLVLTDPPYGNAGGHIERTGGSWGNKKKDVSIKEWDFAPTKEYFDEIFRISKNQIIWGGNYFNLPPNRCFNIWRKLTISESFSVSMCEYAWCSFDSNAKIWAFPPQNKNRVHPSQKPLELITKQILEYTNPNDIVLDCFMGSGTTGIACYNTGRDFIGIEKDDNYFKIAKERIDNAVAQLKLL